ncbi:hypothetical protein V9T40_006793 [Parthenolecanium corni]|uniref:Mitochondrial import inner membrane translocase subunit TIM23 n=1 Tax=Parthenolecanium corni TaxID=536013 RepID=A0AAN9U0E2_9HEMI
MNKMYADNNSSLMPGGGPPSHFATLSPYLNYDPAYIKQTSQPEFILPEGASEKRKRFELAFSQIGSSCIGGALFGGANGFYNGLKKVTLEGQTGKLKGTTLLNYVMKGGSASANTLGVVAVLYSGIGAITEQIRSVDDEINTLFSATATGLIFRSTHGLRKCAIGGGVGFTLAALYCLWTSRDKLVDLKQQFS